MARIVFIYSGGDKVRQEFKQNSLEGEDYICLLAEAPLKDKKKAVANANVLCLMPAKVEDEIIEAAPNLKLVQILTAGYDKINLPLLKERGIRLAANGGANLSSVAVHTVAMILAWLRRIGDCDKAVRDLKWREPIPEFTQFELADRTVGIIGAGRIGRMTASYLYAFGSKIIYYDLHQNNYFDQELKAKMVTKEELVSTADIISIHMPLSDSTRGIVGAAEFTAMKSDALFVNTSRGELVDEKAMIAVLKSHQIAGACLDVFWNEPLKEDNELLQLDNVLLSPHMAGHSAEGWSRRTANAWENIRRLNAGENLMTEINTGA